MRWGKEAKKAREGAALKAGDKLQTDLWDGGPHVQEHLFENSPPGVGELTKGGQGLSPGKCNVIIQADSGQTQARDTFPQNPRLFHLILRNHRIEKP